jgi:hypothetical protein
MKKIFKKFVKVSSLSAFLFFVGCSPTQQIVRQNGVYSWNEPKGTKIDVTLGILESSYSYQTQTSFVQSGQPQSVNEFASAFNKNFYDMMIDKGINTLGPFKNLDEMTFPEKKNSDLVVSPEINFVFSTKQLSAQAKMNSAAYTYNISIGGTLDISILEPLSKERMWLKKLDLKDLQKTITFELKGSQNSDENLMIYINNTYIELLTNFFNSSYPTISKYFNAEELFVLKKQSQELRGKKSY